MNKTARIYNCMRCHCQVIICSHCDRGNIYCGQKCSQAARKDLLGAASKRYQNTQQGKHNHAARQKCYRERKKEIVTHHGSHENANNTDSSQQPETKIPALHCHFCKKHVSNYLRSGFLRHGSSVKTSITGILRQGP